MQWRTLACGLMGFAPLAAWCDQAPAPPPMGVWTGKGQLGFLDSQGNTVAESANAALDMSLLTGVWKHTAHVDALYGKNAAVVSAERYEAQWQSNYNLTTALFVFGALRYEHDLFSGFLYQGSATAGVGYQLFNTPRTKLSVQVGAGDRAERPETLVKNAAGVVLYRVPLARENGVIGTAGLDLTQYLTATTSIADQALIEGGSGNTLISNTLALTVKVSSKLALGIGYNLQDNSNPPAGLKKLDSTETVNLVYSF